jgi:hypothetical protein
MKRYGGAGQNIIMNENMGVGGEGYLSLLLMSGRRDLT